MEIISGNIDWMEGYANSPIISITTSTIHPRISSMKFQNKGNLYFAEKDGFVVFFYYDKPGSGFCGDIFEIKLIDGSIKKLIGPWSCNSGDMNYAGFTQSVDVLLNSRAYGNITLDILQKAISENKIKFGNFNCKRNPFVFPKNSKLELKKNSFYNYVPVIKIDDNSFWEKNIWINKK